MVSELEAKEKACFCSASIALASTIMGVLPAFFGMVGKAGVAAFH
jgi:hypothetical protein